MSKEGHDRHSSYTDIIYFDAFQKLKFSINDLTTMTSSLMGFTSNFISLPGTVSLHVTFKDKLCSKMILARFMLVGIPSTYNAIMD